MKTMKFLSGVLGISLTASSLSAQVKTPVYLDLSKPMEERIEDALSRMTLHEKIGVIHAQSKFSSPGVARLGIPDVWCTDGPHGIRPDVLWDEWEQAGCTNDSCVAFPALSALASTWNVQLANQYGISIGEEARYRKKSVLLGPGCNILRNPLNGRSFEYLGEDPYLSGQMVTQYILGVQEQGVAACVKHYALNNNELNRYTSNVNCDERTLREIYLPAFEAAIKEGHAWSIMGGYNLFRDQHACHNDYLMNKILKGEWGFDGTVISDWGGTQSTQEAIYNSLDMEFGTWTDGLKMGLTNAYDRYYLGVPYETLIKEGKVGTQELDDKVRRVLRMIFRTAMNPQGGFGSMNSEEHIAVARKVGAESIVLLKNTPVKEKGQKVGTPVLPLNLDNIKRLLVVGENAIKMMTVGGGSSSLKAQHEVLPLDGIKARLAGTGIEVVYARGYVGDVGGEYNGVTTGQSLEDNRSAGELIAEAVSEASKADAVIFIGGLNKADHQDAEGFDREQYGLPYGQDAVIEALLAANPHLVVVNISGNPVAMPWAAKVPAILQDWYLGSEAGNSLADVLTGDVNPSGHLAMTWYASLDQCSVFAALDAKGRRLKKQPSAQTIDEIKAINPAQYPGIKAADKDQWDLTYSEGIFVGYRYTDQQNLQPLFPFGHGLSYTTFEMTSAEVKSVNGLPVVTATVKNTGKVAGAQVVQLYVHDAQSSVVRPVKELKGFGKLFLQPGESQTVTLALTERDLSFYDEDSRLWVAEAGRFDLLVGFSSQDIKKALPFNYSK